jgi:hypothetical protein
MASHFTGPLLGSRQALGSAGENMGIEATAGESELVTVHDDFNDVIPNTALAVVSGAAATGPWSDAGWVTTEDAGNAAVADTIGMNDPTDVSEMFHSSIRFFPGTADDSGGNMQLDLVNADFASALNDLTSLSTRRAFPHIWIPENTTATILDNTVITFACRVGFQSGEAVDGDWEGKAFIGFAAAGDTSVMDHDTGVLTDAVGNLHGFHIPEDGSIDGISKRITGDSLVSGTNFTELRAAGAVDGTIANGVGTIGDVLWYDLALRMNITDMSDNDANGSTTFYSRPVLPSTAAPGLAGRGDTSGWSTHTVLSNQTPNHSVALVPTIEVMNGPTAGDDVVFFLDWWSFGISRFSRL